MSEMTVERARRLFRYDPTTGVMYRRRDGRDGMISNLQRGYVRVVVDGKSLLVHRLAWMIMTGGQPPSIIDHINGIPSDNRWCNLRVATASENACNSPLQRPRRSLPVGVEKHQNCDRYRATVTKDYCTWRSPWLEKLEDAIALRREKAIEMHGAFRRTA